ncbi:MAG: hypothetical protein ABIP54_01890 [Candidatus Andersenbacteria bacterium]
MKLRTWIFIILQTCIVAGIIYGLHSWATATQHLSLLRIQGGIEESLAVPVFAQFTAGQTLQLQGEHLVSEIILPLYIPEHAQQIKILLYQNNKLVNWWKEPINNQNTTGITYFHLPFIEPTVLSGNLDLQLNGTQITYTDNAEAPGFFIETQDRNYPLGNYRIANNEKSGDIAMQFIEEKTNLQLFLEKVRIGLFGQATFILILLAFLLVVLILPVEILQLRKKL